ncbi:NmrA family NAD(P)-binding protein [Mycobacterium sp. HNNTM2301]|uniref:NmrA family NAD(P)-binding protein n=1 Tax=Mycobacterium hainanense TaxID=3289775 RepID=UPI0035A7222E
MILVISAAGGVGRPLVRGLTVRGLKVRAFVKNSAQAQLSRTDGAAEIAVGDLRATADLERALVGVRQVYHVAPTQVIDEVPIAEVLIKAAGAAGVEHIAFHSVIHPDIKELVHHHQKLLVEDLLHKSQIPFTILRPSHYMQNYLEFWQFILAGLAPYPVSTSSVMGVVDVEDVAEVAANVLARPDDHIGKTYDLSAQELTRDQMAEIWAKTLGHNVTAVRLPPDAVNNPLAAASSLPTIVFDSLRNVGLRALPEVIRGLREASNARGINSWPREARNAYVTMMTYYDGHGLPAGDLDDLPRLLNRPPTTYAQFARRIAIERGAL